MFKKTSNESNDPESRVAFLHDQNSDNESREKEPYSRHRSLYQRHSPALTVHIPLFLCNILLTPVSLLWSKTDSDYRLVPTPAQASAARYPYSTPSIVSSAFDIFYTLTTITRAKHREILSM